MPSEKMYKGFAKPQADGLNPLSDFNKSGGKPKHSGGSDMNTPYGKTGEDVSKPSISKGMDKMPSPKKGTDVV